MARSSSPRKSPSVSRTGSFLTKTARFRRPALAVAFGLFAATGSIMLYASLASSIPVVNTNAEFWRGRIAGCESGSGPNSTPNYQAVNGSGHYGAYQYDKSTWKGAVGPELYATYPDPRTAPPAVQDQAFYNTFARRGSQPWNASYRCWRTPELAQQNSPANIIQLLPRLGSSGSVAPTPTPLPKNAYNVTVQGRVYINNKLTPGVKLVTCVDGVTTQTDAGGVFRFELPAGKEYCVRTIDGLPSSARLVKTNNNPERTNEISYEHQLAAKNYYRNFWQFFTQYYTWDRPVDDNFDFYFVSQ